MQNFKAYFILENENDFQIGDNMSEKYNTKQRRQVLTTIKHQSKDFTAKDIYESLGGEIGLTTVYRFIESLEKEGVIIRVSLNGNSKRYQYVEPCDDDDHFYLKCVKCGKMQHIDCEKIQGLTTHILIKHHFTPTNTHLVIKGICKDCEK